MLNRLVASAALAALIVAGAAGGALAQTTESCLQAAFDLAKAAEAKQPSEDQAKAMEALLTKIESHCDNQQYKEAEATSAELKAMIDKL